MYNRNRRFEKGYVMKKIILTISFLVFGASLGLAMSSDKAALQSSNK